MVKFVMRTLWLHHSLTYVFATNARFRALIVIPLSDLTLCLFRVSDIVLSMFVEILLLTLQLASTSTNDRLVCVHPSLTFPYGRHSPLCRLLVMNVFRRLPRDWHNLDSLAPNR